MRSTAVRIEHALRDSLDRLPGREDGPTPPSRAGCRGADEQHGKERQDEDAAGPGPQRDPQQLGAGDGDPVSLASASVDLTATMAGHRSVGFRGRRAVAAPASRRTGPGGRRSRRAVGARRQTHPQCGRRPISWRRGRATLFNSCGSSSWTRPLPRSRQPRPSRSFAPPLTATMPRRDRPARGRACGGHPGVAERLVSIYKRGRGGYARLLLSAAAPSTPDLLGRGGGGSTARASGTADPGGQRAAWPTSGASDRGGGAAGQGHGGSATLDGAVAPPAMPRLPPSTAGATGGAMRRRTPAGPGRPAGDGQHARRDAARPAVRTVRGTLDWPVSGRLVAIRPQPEAVSAPRSSETASRSRADEARRCWPCTAGREVPRSRSRASARWSSSTTAAGVHDNRPPARSRRGARRAGRSRRPGRERRRHPRGIPALFRVRVDGRPVDLQWLRSSP